MLNGAVYLVQCTFEILVDSCTIVCHPRLLELFEGAVDSHFKNAQDGCLLQVLPQLLHYMDVDAEDPESPDWGCIAVYSCPNSCTPTGKDDQSSYMEEFAWVQPP